MVEYEIIRESLGGAMKDIRKILGRRAREDYKSRIDVLLAPRLFRFCRPLIPFSSGIQVTYKD